MFLALGVGAWTAAMFHLMTHAFFKALLFLSAGVVIHCLHHEHDIFKMGGLRKRLPAAFWSFLIGGASLAGLPLLTAGFYSKDLILWEAWSSDGGSAWLWAAGVVGAFITAIYIFRVLFVVFFGEEHTQTEKRPGFSMRLSLGVLAFFAITAGFVEIPKALGDFHWFYAVMATVFPVRREGSQVPGIELASGIIAGAVTLLGIYLAYVCCLRKPLHASPVGRAAPVRAIQKFLFGGWGFDWLYHQLFVRPFLWIARINKGDFTDSIYSGMAALCRVLHFLFRSTETGRVRTYAVGLTVGSLILIALAVLL
jgi:NADH-quinone oxidoreductase subunit L